MTGHNAHGGHEPSAAYKAVELLKGVKLYGDALAESVRHMKSYRPEELEEKGITKDGKVSAEGIWAYVNGHFAKSAIKGQNFDPEDPRWLPVYAAVNNAVKRFGSKGLTTDFIEAVIGVYLQTANTYAAEKDQQMIGAMPTEQGKKATEAIAKLTGDNVVYGPWIKQATDPTEVAGIKANLEDPLRNKVNTAIATGTLDDLIKAA